MCHLGRPKWPDVRDDAGVAHKVGLGLTRWMMTGEEESGRRMCRRCVELSGCGRACDRSTVGCPAWVSAADG